VRQFTIAHISDLHIKTADDPGLAVLKEGLHAALRDFEESSVSEPTDLSTVDPNTVNNKWARVLVVTGDLVDSPTKQSLEFAKRFVDSISGDFDHVFVIPGNHDVKKHFGSFGFDDTFHSIFDNKKDLLVRNAGLHLIGVDSTPAAFAKGKVDSTAYDKMVFEVYRSEDLPESERQGMIRVVAIHHHPLPLPEGEGVKIAGLVPDEGLMYLQSPARFLDACRVCGVSLILHGHRHAGGLVRYSVQSDQSVDIYHDDQWSDLYVLACPSSTGRGCDAGFNLLHFWFSSGSFIDVRRYRRPKNEGRFIVVDDKRPNGNARLHLEHSLIRDVAIDVAVRISALPRKDTPESELLELATQLFRRRAFYFDAERNWGLLLYALIRTRFAWEQEVITRLRQARRQAGREVLAVLLKLEDYVADKVLKLGAAELSDMTAKYIENKAEFLRRVPQVELSHHDKGKGNRSQPGVQ
jgi:3',5'-cyclic-AMP phosphodiesterase